MKHFYSFLLFFVAISSISVFATEVIPPSSESRPVSKEDFFKHRETTKNFNETWSYLFVFNNGTKAYVNFTSLNIPSQGRKIGCDLSFWNSKWKNPSVGRQYPPERLVEDQEKNRISIKEEYFMENLPGKGHRVYFTADKGGLFFLDLTFTSAILGKVPGDGIWKLGREQHAQYIHIPHGKVTGRIGFNGDTISVNGYGYMDHSWQTFSSIDFISRSINFSMPWSKSMFAGRLSLSKKGVPLGYALYIKEGNAEIAMPHKIFDNGKPYSGKEFPTKEIEVKWTSSAPEFKFDVSNVQQRFSILNNFDGWLAKKAAKFMMGGEVLFYRGRSLKSGKAIDWNITGL